MTVLPDVASVEHSEVVGVEQTVTAGKMQIPVLNIKLRDQFGNARTTSGDGRQMCIHIRPTDTSDLYSCSICIAQPMDGAHNSSQCQLGRCGKVCSSNDNGFELVYNRSIASQVVLEALLVASDFVSCSSKGCVPVAACSSTGQMLPAYDRCSALNIGCEIGSPSVLTVVPGRTGPPLLFFAIICTPTVYILW
jgi:hypothetical protein